MERRFEQWCPEHITTGFVARHCGVSNATVVRWIDKELLTAFRLPDGHYRIRRDDFAEFLTKYRIPVYYGATGSKRSNRHAKQGGKAHVGR